MNPDSEPMGEKIVVEGEPVPKARPRVGKHGNIYTPRETTEYESLVAWHARAHRPAQGLVGVHLWFFVSPKKKLADLDNLIKSVLDGLQMGGLIKNDQQVATIHAYRVESEAPRMEADVYELRQMRSGTEAVGEAAA